MLKHWQRGVTGALVILLGACATPAVQPTLDWDTRSRQLSALTLWSFSGKVLVKTEHGADSANLHWAQEGTDLQLELSGPLGLKPMRLVKEGAELRIFYENQWQSIAANDTALAELTGWPLPLELLPWWLRGIPAPAPAPAELVLADGYLQKLQQAGWEIEYADYQMIDQQQLPQSMRFRSSNVEGRILFKRWQLSP